MKLKMIAAALAAFTFAAGCQTTGAGSDQSVKDFCADSANADNHVCQVKLELDGHTKDLADTSLSLAEARQVADDALTEAEAATKKAEEARAIASSALNQSALTCKTLTIQKSKTGSCEPGYTLMSCTQTRFTYSAGGLSILREISDEQCRFHDRVLEMQVRCCTMGAQVVN